MLSSAHRSTSPFPRRRRDRRWAAALLVTTVAAGAALVPGAAPARAQTTLETFATVDQALDRSFPDADRFDSEEIPITGELREALEDRLRKRFPFRSVEVHSAYRGDARLGRAIVTEEIGEYRPFTFLVAVDPSNAVGRVELLVYRESYGSEVGQREFMDQYQGRVTGDRMRLGKEIDSVSGATRSARAVSKGVRRTLYFFEVLDRHRAGAGTSGGSEARAAP